MDIAQFADSLKTLLYQDGDINEIARKILTARYTDGRLLSDEDIEYVLSVLRYGKPNSNGYICLNESDNSALLELVNAIEKKVKEGKNNG